MIMTSNADIPPEKFNSIFATKVEKKVKISYTFNDLIFAYKVIFNEVDILQKEYKRRKEETYKKSEVILEEMSAELGISVGSIRSKIYNKQRG